MARPRKQTYTLEMYLKKNRKGDIDNNADVQRNFVWNNEQINELIVTVLTDDYMPPIILGEEENSKLHIVDGGCRTAALRKFREMNYKITSSIENSLIPYKKKVKDRKGNITYKDDVFDIKNKTFDKLPEELREKFDEYQIETVIHECCDYTKVSRYIKRYNNHVAMNTDQRAFTYIDKYANRIRRILDSRFFAECSSYSENDKTKGVVERVIVETMMCMYHFDNWKTQPKAACKYLNHNATEQEFDVLADNLHRLEKVITDDIKDIFNKKDSFIFLTLFDRFLKFDVQDDQFAGFLREFKSSYRAVRRNEKGLLFDEINKELSTKDKQVIADKLAMLEGLLGEFLHFDGTEASRQEINILAFVREHVDLKVSSEDIRDYQEDFEVLTLYVDNRSRLLEPENRLSLLAVIAYGYKNEIRIDDWFVDYFKKNRQYRKNQKQNYVQMVNSLKKYISGKDRRSA